MNTSTDKLVINSDISLKKYHPYLSLVGQIVLVSPQSCIQPEACIPNFSNKQRPLQIILRSRFQTTFSFSLITHQRASRWIAMVPKN